MDSRLALFVVLDIALVCFALWTIISPQSVWALGSAWKYRNREAMEPSARRYRMIRSSGAAQLSLWIPPLVGLAWPGDGLTKFSAGFAAAGVCVVAIVTILLIVSAVGAKRRRERSIAEKVPVSELSEAGYGVSWLEVGYTFAYVIVVGLIMLVAVGSAQASQRDYEARRDATMTPEDQEHVDELLNELFPVVERTGFEVLTAVPEGALVGYPSEYTSEDSTITIGQAVRSCAATGVVRIEAADSVSVGIVYDASGAVAAGLTPEEFCPLVVTPMGTRETFTVALEAPLGGREVSSIDGRYVPPERNF